MILLNLWIIQVITQHTLTMKDSKKEDELASIKLRALQHDAQMGMKEGEAVQWFCRFGLKNQLPNVPRISHLELIGKLVQGHKQYSSSLFGREEVVGELLENCTQLYDLAFVIEKHANIKPNWLATNFLISKLYTKFTQFCDHNADMQALLYLQGVNMYATLSQSSSKQPAATFLGLIYQKQRKQAGKVYEYVLKPLFEKKDLKAYYMKLIGLVGWLMFMDAKIELVADLAKKINIFMLYHKDEDSLEMIHATNMLFDWLSVRFPREAMLNHSMLAALLSKLKNTRMSAFFDIWLQQRLIYVTTIDFEFMLRTLTLMGLGSIVLDVLNQLWLMMKSNRCFGVLLRLFSGYVRKQFLHLWLERGQDLDRYVKLAQLFMVGLSNRQRFQGQQIDELTANLGKHILIRHIPFNGCYKRIIQFYAIYENRFSFLSQTSKRFLREMKERYNCTIETPVIHELFNKMTIRELMADDDDEQQYWQKGKVSYRYRGLQNMGNTCYINAFMQCLFMTKKFRAFIHLLTKDDMLPSSMLKTYALQNLFDELLKKDVNKQTPYRPEYFRIELPEPFNNSFQQQDTGQFGRMYLDLLDKELGKQYGSRLQKLLIQRLNKTIRCTTCSTEKQKIQKVFDLILSISRQDNELYLSKLVQQYFQPELFTGDNRIMCNKCNDKKDAVSELLPDKLSEVVVLTLNLFDYVEEGIKILTPLIFEFTLNFDVLLNGKGLGEYQLYAFIVHLGSNIGGGHYICYARNLQENPMIWFCLDDGYVTQRQISKADEFGFGPNETPYMLFYSKTTTRNVKNSGI